jgi:hypothetical protein
MVRFLTDSRVVDQGPGSRQLQVIAAGLSRCATSSLQAALESPHLGFDPSMHMAHVSPHPDREQLVIDAMQEENRERRHKLLHQLFDGYSATADFPGWMFVDDLMDMYPKAKVVLNQRKSGKAWADSIRNSLAFFGTKTYLLIGYPIQTDRLHYQIHQTVYKSLERRFKLEPEKLYSPEFYDKHNQWVRDEAAKRGKEVLEFQAEHGWKPLCEFLGKPPPPVGVPFPHLNDQREITILKTIIIVRGLLAWSAWGAALYGASILARRYLFR